MKENILHLVWKYGLLDTLNCYSTDGEKIEILNLGFHNDSDSGPDFFNAKLKIGNTIWFGNVEIHYKTSDWFNHLHHLDSFYQSVILHVVYEDDCGHIEGTKKFPIIELKKCVNPEVWDRILLIDSSKNKIPCSNYLNKIKPIDWINWQDRLVVERFEQKVKDVDLFYALNKQDWSKVVFQLLTKSLGGSVNKEPFLILSRLVPLEVIKRHRSDLLAIEAILFGVSGMLNGTFSDLYPRRLQQEYSFYKQKFNLDEMENYWWKWLRLRPIAFPTIQIAILASLLYNSTQLENIFEIKDFERFKQKIRLSTVLSPYWENHYKFDKASKEKVKNWGIEQITRIFINGVIPYQIAKKKALGANCFNDIIGKLNDLKPENNKIIRIWNGYKVPISSSYESQAMIELYNNYCSRKKCLHCNVGLKFLNQTKYDKVLEGNT